MKISKIVICSKCKHWDAKPYFEDYTVRICKHPKINGSDDQHMTDGIVQCGMDAGYPDNCTGPDFGCVHGEES